MFLERKKFRYPEGSLGAVPALDALVVFHDGIFVSIGWTVPIVPGSEPRFTSAVFRPLTAVVERAQFVRVFSVAVLVTLAVHWLLENLEKFGFR